MRTHTIAVIGSALVLVGAVGLAVMFMLGNTAMLNGPIYANEDASGGSGSLGERIYLTGIGADGAIPRTGGVGRMGSGGCITCHGEDGQGGEVGMMMRFIDAPAITYEDLTGTHDEHDSEAEAPWTDADIARVIRTGVEPDGDRLDPIMPRWEMSDREMDALIDYLKTL